MAYKVRGTASTGETFYVDGSMYGKEFRTVEEAISYAEEYARAVGEVSLPPNTLLRATKADGYFENISIEDTEERASLFGITKPMPVIHANERRERS